MPRSPNIEYDRVQDDGPPQCKCGDDGCAIYLGEVYCPPCLEAAYEGSVIEAEEASC